MSDWGIGLYLPERNARTERIRLDWGDTRGAGQRQLRRMLPRPLLFWVLITILEHVCQRRHNQPFLRTITSDDDGDDRASSVENFKGFFQSLRGSPATRVATWLHTAHGRPIVSNF